MSIKLTLEPLTENRDKGRLLVNITTDNAVRPKLEFCNSEYYPYQGSFIKFRGYLGAEGFGKDFVRVCYLGISKHQEIEKDFQNVLQLPLKVLRKNIPDGYGHFIDFIFQEGTNVSYAPGCRCARVNFDYKTQDLVPNFLDSFA
jgi:hypothetical protein